MKQCNTLFLLFGVGILQLISCGGSSEQGNARCNFVSGKVLMSGQVKNAHMELVPDYFNALNNDTAAVYRTESDNSGNYEFKNVKTGYYYLNAVNPRDGHRVLRGPIFIEPQKNESKDLGKDSLVAPSKITAIIDDIINNKPAGIFVKGTTRIIPFKDITEKVQIDSVPAGTIDLMYALKNSSQDGYASQPFLNQLEVHSEDTLSVSYNNMPPHLISDSKPLNKDSLSVNDTMFLDTIKAIDPEGGIVMYRLISAPPGLKLDSLTGVISWHVVNDTSSQFRVGFRVEDKQGAGITVWVAIYLRAQQSKPSQPYVLFGNSDTLFYMNSSITVGMDSLFCPSLTAHYRFSWGDGDTSDWAYKSNASHIWNRSGTFEVRGQIRCSDNVNPTLWTDPLKIVIGSGWDIGNLLPAIQPSSIFAGDTFRISIDSTGGDSLFVKFFWNDSSIGSWTNNRSIQFSSPGSGIYMVKAAAAYDTLSSFISFSKPCSVSVMPRVPCSVIPTGDSSYAWSETLGVNIRLDMGSCTGTDSITYRFNIEKVDSVATFSDTTDWSFEPSTIFYLLDPASTYKIRAQSRDKIDLEIKKSEWSPWFFIHIN
jgi:hypothetical protein